MDKEQRKREARERREREAQERQDAYVKEIVDAAPPLTEEQRDRLRVIFAPAVREWAAKKRDAARSD